MTNLQVVVAGGALVAALLSACSSPAPSLDTTTAPPAVRGVGLRGEIRAEEVDGRVCFWVEPTPGHATALLWPAGYRAERNPFRVVDGSGTEAVRIGTIYELGGGVAPEGSRPCKARARVYHVSRVG